MGASRYIGRVGGLAVALGVGVGLFAAAGAAWADSADDGGRSGAASAPADRADRGPAAKASGAAARGGHNARPAATVSRSATSAALTVAAPSPAPSEAVDPEPVPTGLVDTGTEDATPVMYAVGGSANATATNNGVTVNPTVAVVNGVFQGVLNATSATGQALRYTYVGSSSGGKLDLGDVPNGPGTTDPQSFTLLPYATWLDAGGTEGVQTFTVRVSENTAFDQFITGLPLIGTLASPIISLLQQAPLISNLLAPIIGGSVLAVISVDTAAPVDPFAYTYKVTSFDGVEISTNFFPKNGLLSDELAYTVLNGPGLGGAGATNPYATSSTSASVPGLAVLRSGYNVITWDPRGEFASGGILELDNPFYEGRDVSAIIDWAASDTPAQRNGANDPAVGMIGGSYGGGIQMSTVDPRLDAIVPAIAWNSLNSSLYPDEIFKTAWANVFGLALLTTGARVNGEVYPALLSGNLIGLISETAQAVLGSSGPTALLSQLQAPTLLVQGIVDALFPLAESIQNAETIVDGINPYGTPVKMIWFCGGHGVCLDLTVEEQAAQAATYFAYEVAWLDKYVKGVQIPDAFTPTFQWWDQLGDRYTSDLYPFDPNFNQDFPLTAYSEGGQLAVLPFAIGGSGPNTDCATAAGSAGCSWPLSWVFATEAPMAINVPITPTAGQQVVGAPTVTFSYSGLGTARAVYGQIVDNTTGRVLGNIVTPIPVTLDGQTHQVSAQLADIAYTAGAAPSLTLQIVGGASQYWNSAIGLVNISDVQVDLPIRA